jgi:hypothetical protein
MESEQPSRPTSSGKPSVAGNPAGQPKAVWPIGQRGRMALAGALVMLLAVGLYFWQRCPSSAPSERPDLRTPISTQDSAQKKVVQQPAGKDVKARLLPGLKSGLSQLVPGLENVRVGFNVSLTDDLRTIVFAKTWQRSPYHGLYIADRPDALSPFGEPRMIESAGDPPEAANRVPYLSPDGLELIFGRGDQLLYCRRSSRSAEFDAPTVWLAADGAGEGKKPNMARFLDPLRVLIATENVSHTESYSFLIAERADLQSEFGPPKEIFLGEYRKPRICLRPNLLVVYTGADKGGIFVQRRNSDREPFGPRICVIDAEACGPVRASVWVTPGDEAIFYCSPGVGNDPNGEMRVWMIGL